MLLARLLAFLLACLACFAVFCYVFLFAGRCFAVLCFACLTPGEYICISYTVYNERYINIYIYICILYLYTYKQHTKYLNIYI